MSAHPRNMSANSTGAANGPNSPGPLFIISPARGFAITVSRSAPRQSRSTILSNTLTAIELGRLTT